VQFNHEEVIVGCSCHAQRSLFRGSHWR
jgi:hypothetical protein